MRNTITLNGISSDTITGLLIQELPAISKPLMRTTIEEIDGRDGDIVTELGYSAYDKEITIGLYGSFDINAVIAYFATEGTVVFSNEPDKFYRYKIIDQIDYERLVRYRTATVKLHCQPFKYPTSETPVQLGSGQTVTAEGTDTTMQGTALAPFASVIPKGDTSQQTYTGKNLAKATNVNLTDSSYTLTISNSHIYINSKSADNSFDLCGGLRNGKWLPTYENANDYHLTSADGGTYTLSAPNFQQSGISANWTISVFTNQRAINNTFKTGTDFSSATTTLRTDEYIKSVYVWTGGGAENGTVQFDLQLEAGSTATSFEPYVGGTASPNPDYPQDVKVVTGEQTVTVSGKNMLNEATMEQGGFNFRTGENYSHNNQIRSKTIKCLPSTTYVISDKESLGEFAVVYGSQTGAVIEGSNKSTTAKFWSFTTPANAYSMRIRIGSNDYPKNTSGSYDIQLELGSTATAYEPYQGQEYQIGLHGKNLINLAEFTIGGMYNGNPEPATKYRINNAQYPIRVKPNTTYTLSAQLVSPVQGYRVGVHFCGKNGEFLRDSGWKQLGGVPNTFTTQSNEYYVKMVGSLSTTSTTVTTGSTENTTACTTVAEFQRGCTLQFEEGSTATAYEAYTPLELCKIGDYQDYIYKSGGNWYKHEVIKKTTLPTSGYSLWSTQPTARMYYKNGALSDALFQKGIVTAVIENLPVKPQVGNMTEYYNTYAQENKYGFVLKVDTPGFMVQNKDYGSTTTFQYWLEHNPVTVRYVLATPVNTKITNEALIEQLNALGNANSYRDTTHITTASNGTDLPVILAVTATGKADGTVTNAGNTYAKPKLTIYGTGTIGIYLNGNQMFQIELGSEGHITIDTEKMEAYKDSESNLKNRLVTGDYSKFRLEAGANQINFSGNINKCVVENYTRWL